jgi:hypothetical protein
MSPKLSSVPDTHAPPFMLAYLGLTISLSAQERFAARIRVISRPPDCDTATLRGAAQYGLARRPLVSSVIAPQSYMMKVRAAPVSWEPCYSVTSPLSTNTHRGYGLC